MYILAMVENHKLIMTMKKKQQFLQHKEKHKNTKAYTYDSNSMGKKVGFAAVFTDIVRRSLHSHS